MPERTPAAAGTCRRIIVVAVCAALGGFSCREPARVPLAAPDLSYLPSNVLFVAFADTGRLKASPLYREWDSRVAAGKDHLIEAKTFLRRLGVDPEKDVDGVMLAYRPAPVAGEWLALLRGRFDLNRIEKRLQDPSTRMSVEPYRRWSLYNLALVPDLGDLSLALVDSSALALGKAETLKQVLDTRNHPGSSLAGSALMKRMIATLKPEAQVWALLDGRALWRNLGDRQRTLQDGSESLALGNLSSVVSASLSAWLTADLSLHLEIGSDSEKHAQSLADALKGILGFARLGSRAKEPDLARLVEAIKVEGEGERVRLHADLPGDLAKQLEARLEATR